MIRQQQIREELRLLDRETGESHIDDAFLAGVRRALEWTQGVGVSPSEFLKMCNRIPVSH